MPEVAPIAILALAIAYATLRSRRADTAQLIEPRGAVPVMGIQIICGDCSGDEGQPRKTYVGRFGNCAQCGGGSYVLASNFAFALRLRAARLKRRPRTIICWGTGELTFCGFPLTVRDVPGETRTRPLRSCARMSSRAGLLTEWRPLESLERLASKNQRSEVRNATPTIISQKVHYCPGD